MFWVGLICGCIGSVLLLFLICSLIVGSDK